LTARSRLLETYLDGLILYYPFHEGAGAFAEDLSPFKRYGTITNCAWATGPLEEALLFSSAADDHVDTPSFVLASATNCLTFTFWVNCATIPFPFGTIFNSNGEINSPCFFIDREDDDLWVGFYNSSTINVVVFGLGVFGAPFDNVWVHFAIVVDFTVFDIDWYRNGIYLGKHPDGGGPGWVFPNHSGIKRLGQTTGGTNKYNGYIDEFRIFDRALTAAEVFQDYYKAARQHY